MQVQCSHPDDHSRWHDFERSCHEHLFRRFHLGRHVDTGEEPSYRRPAKYAAGQPGGVSLSRGERTGERYRAAAHRSTLEHMIPRARGGEGRSVEKSAATRRVCTDRHDSRRKADFPTIRAQSIVGGSTQHAG
jgi:hypothetical protein